MSEKTRGPRSSSSRWSLSKAQAAAWSAALTTQMREVGISRADVILKMGRPASFKSELSRFISGEDEGDILRRWLETKSDKYARPFADALGWTTDDLSALFDRVRSGPGEASVSRRPWHPSFPGIFEDEIRIRPPMARRDGERKAQAGGRKARVCGPPDLGLRCACDVLRAGDPSEARQAEGPSEEPRADGPVEDDRVKYAEIEAVPLGEAAASPAPRPGEVVFTLLPWGVAQALRLIERLRQRARLDEAQSARLAEMETRLSREPGLLGALDRPGEIIAWLGRVAAGRPVEDARQARDTAIATETRQWFDGAAGTPLRCLGEAAIDEILFAGWAADAWSEAEWLAVIADRRPQPAGFWDVPDLLAATRDGRGAKATPELVEALLGLRTPATVLTALIAGGVLTRENEGGRIAPARRVTFWMRVGRALARRPDAGAFWLARAHHAWALEVLREAASAGLPWRAVGPALREAPAATRIDACRAAMAFATHTPTPDAVLVDETFVQWWAGAMCAALLGVHHADALYRTRLVELAEPRREPTSLTPAEEDLARLPESVTDRLPMLFAEEIPGRLTHLCAQAVLADIDRWDDARERWDDVERPWPGVARGAAARLAPRNVLPDGRDWRDAAWDHAERGAAWDARILRWLSHTGNEPPPISIVAPAGGRFWARWAGPDQTARTVSPPKRIRARWMPRGEDRSAEALAHWMDVSSNAFGRSEVPLDDGEFAQLATGLKAFDEDAVADCVTEALSDGRPMLWMHFRESDLALRLAEALELREILARTAAAYRVGFRDEELGLRWKGVLTDGDLDWFHRTIRASLLWGVDIAKAAHRLGVPEELRAWAVDGPGLTLPPDGARAYHRWQVLRAAGRPESGSGPSPAPPEAVCARQLDAWLTSERSFGVSLWTLPSVLRDCRRLRDLAPLRALLTFASIHGRTGADTRIGDDDRLGIAAAIQALRRLECRPSHDPIDVALLRVALTAIDGHYHLSPPTDELLAWADSVVLEPEPRELHDIAESVRLSAEEALFLVGDADLDAEVMAAIAKRPTSPRGQRLLWKLRDEDFEGCFRRLAENWTEGDVPWELRSRLGLPAPARPSRSDADEWLEAMSEAPRERRLAHICHSRPPDAPAIRAFIAGLADEALEAGRLSEALYLNLRAKKPVAALVRRMLDEVDLVGLADEFERVGDFEKIEQVTGGRNALCRLAREHATEAQIVRLIEALSDPPSSRTRGRAVPDPTAEGAPAAPRPVEALLASLGPETRHSFGLVRLARLHQGHDWARNAPLAEVWAALDRVRRGPGEIGEWLDAVFHHGDPCLDALVERDPDRLVAMGRAWIAEPDIDPRFAREVVRRLLRARPDLGVNLFETLWDHPNPENRDWARRWAAETAATLPHGGALLRRITAGE